MFVWIRESDSFLGGMRNNKHNCVSKMKPKESICGILGRKVTDALLCMESRYTWVCKYTPLAAFGLARLCLHRGERI